MPCRFRPSYTLAQFAELIGRSPAVARRQLRDVGVLAPGQRGRQVIDTAELREKCPSLLASIATVYNGRRLRELVEGAWAEVDAPRGVSRIGRGGTPLMAERSRGEAPGRGTTARLAGLERSLKVEVASLLEDIRAGREADEAASANNLALRFGAPEHALLTYLREATQPARDVAARLREFEIESPADQADAMPLLVRLNAVA